MNANKVALVIAIVAGLVLLLIPLLVIGAGFLFFVAAAPVPARQPAVPVRVEAPQSVEPEAAPEVAPPRTIENDDEENTKT